MGGNRVAFALGSGRPAQREIGAEGGPVLRGTASTVFSSPTFLSNGKIGSALALPNRSRRLVQQRKRAATDVSAFASGWRRHVRVFANISSVTGFLPEALASFLRDHPDIEVSLEDRSTSDILHAIRTGAADIGLVFATVSAPDLQLSPWREDRLVALMRPDPRSPRASQSALQS